MRFTILLAFRTPPNQLPHLKAPNGNDALAANRYHNYAQFRNHHYGTHTGNQLLLECDFEGLSYLQFVPFSVKMYVSHTPYPN